MTLGVGLGARRRSRRPCSITALVDTCPARMIASSLTATRMSSPGKQLLQRLLQRRDAGIDDDVVLLAPAGAPDDQADGAGAPAVDQHLARLHHDGVGDRRIGDGDAGDVEVGRQHHRPAGGEHQHAIAIDARPGVVGRGRRLAGRRCCGAGAGAGAWAPAPAIGTGRSNVDSTNTHVITCGLLLRSAARRAACSSPSFFDRLGRPLGAANRFDGVRERWRRRRRRRARRRRPARRVAARRGAAGGGAAPACPSARRRGCRRSRSGAVSSGLRSVSVMRPSADGQRDALGVLGRDQQRHHRGRDRPAVLPGLLLVEARAGGQHLHVRHDHAGDAVAAPAGLALERDDDVDARARARRSRRRRSLR